MGAASHNSGICELLQKSLVRFCVENYTATADIEIDAIICLSVVNSSQQNVVKVHEVLPKHWFRNSNTPGYAVAGKKNGSFQLQIRKRKRQMARKKQNFKKKCDSLSFQKSQENLIQGSSSNSIDSNNKLRLTKDGSKSDSEGPDYGYEYETDPKFDNNSLTINNSLSNRVSFDQERTCTIISLEDMSVASSNTHSVGNDKSVINNSELCSETMNVPRQLQNNTDSPTNSNNDLQRKEMCTNNDEMNDDGEPQSSHDYVSFRSDSGKESPDVVGENRFGIKVKQEPVNIEYNDYENNEPCTSKGEETPSINLMEATFLERTFQSQNNCPEEITYDKSPVYFEPYTDNVQFSQNHSDPNIKSTVKNNGAIHKQTIHVKKTKKQEHFRGHNSLCPESQSYPVVFGSKSLQNNPSQSFPSSHDTLNSTRPFMIMSPEKQKNFFCEKCGTGFTCRRSLLRHMRCTCGTTMFECNICGKFYSRSDSKQRHMWKMHGVKLQNANQDPNVITVSSVIGAQVN